MVNTTVIPDFSPSSSYSELPAHVDDMKAKRHWWDLTNVTDSVFDVEYTLEDQMFIIDSSTAVSGLNLPASDSDSAGQTISYVVINATNTITIARDGTDTIGGSGADLTLVADATGYLISTGNGNWAHVTSSVVAATANLDVKTKTVSYTILATDDAIEADASAGPITMTLPTASGNSGKVLNIVKIDNSGNTVTVEGNGSEMISGSLMKLLTSQWASLTVYSNGSSWTIR